MDPQTPVAAVKEETSPVLQMFHEDSKPDETNAQMDSGPEVFHQSYESDETVDSDETSDETSPNNHSNEQSELVPSLRRTTSIMNMDPQTPVAAVKEETSPVLQMFHEDSKPDENNAQMDSGPDVFHQSYEYDETVDSDEICDETSPNNHSNEQSELFLSLRRTRSIMTFHRESKPDETCAQNMDPQTPVAEVKEETSPVLQMFHEDSQPDEANAQMDSEPEVFHQSYEYDETVDSDETCDETSPENHSNEQSELVPSLRCTKDIMMARVQDVAGSLYSSSDVSTEVTSISKPERDSRRLRRSSPHPNQMNLVESDYSSIDGDDESISCSTDESTESESRLQFTLRDKKKNKGASSESRSKSSNQKPRESGSESSRQERSKSSSQNTSEFWSQSLLEISQKRPFETSLDPTQKCLNSRVDGNEKKMVAPFSKKDVSVSVPLEEEQSVFVSPVLKKKDGSRIYNKKHFCLYCRKFVNKMSRHLWHDHHDEIDVAKAFSLPKNSKRRKLQLDYIRNKGNFEHNSDVLETKKGKLIPCKQPQKKSEGHEFLHCVHCYGLFSRKSMWRHFQVCSFKPESVKLGRTRVQALCAFGPVPAGFNDAYWKFLSVMHGDTIAVAIKEDSCILEYGYRLFKKNERRVSQHQCLRQKLRELGRLLLEARKCAKVKTIQELIKPDQYVQVVKAVKSLSGFSEQTGKYKCPALACKVGYSLQSLSMFIKSDGLKKKDQQATQDAEEFAQLYQESWRFDIANQASAQLGQNKWDSPQLLPFTLDIQKLHCHLAEKQQQHLNDLQEHPSPSNWKELAKVTLTQVVLFNRRGKGGVSRILLSAYLSKDISDTHGDVSLALTPLEQKLCKQFVWITIIEKTGRKVPVLLTPLMRESLDVLTKKREECGVLCENGYLFALPRSLNHLSASLCLRQFVKECDQIKNPRALTSTKLEKYVATLSTVLNLKTTELVQFADFLGHNVAVHRNHYRRPEDTLQLAKISKVLLAMEEGCYRDYKGKSLDEVQVDVYETIGIEGRPEEDIEEVSLPGEEGSEDEESVSSLHDCTSTSQVENQGAYQTGDVSMSGEQGSEDEASTSSLQECPSTSKVQNMCMSAGQRGKRAAVKRWTAEEIAAVEKHLKMFIVSQEIPGKADCERCISAEPQALQKRDWKTVKYFVNNRIVANVKKIRRKAVH